MFLRFLPNKKGGLLVGVIYCFFLLSFVVLSFGRIGIDDSRFFQLEKENRIGKILIHETFNQVKTAIQKIKGDPLALNEQTQANKIDPVVEQLNNQMYVYNIGVVRITLEKKHLILHAKLQSGYEVKQSFWYEDMKVDTNGSE